MQLAELIRSRRSIGAFTSDLVSLELVEELLETAVWAPNHRLTEPWRFIILTDAGREHYAAIRRDMALDGMKNQSEAEREQAAVGVYQKFLNVPAYLIVAMTTHPNPEIREEDYAATASLIQNFLLLAHDRGLGTCWKTFKEDARLRTYLGLGADEKVVGIIHMGYPAPVEVQSQRRPIHDRITILRG